LRRGLRRAGIEFDEVNIWEDPAGAPTVWSITGGDETVPTVVIGDTAMVNPSPRRVVSELRAGAGQPPRATKCRPWPWRRPSSKVEGV
jgi:glutaredoxin